MAAQQTAILKAALEWHLDQGVNAPLVDAPIDRTVAAETPPAPIAFEQPGMPAPAPLPPQNQSLPLGKVDARAEAAKLAAAAGTLDELKAAIAEFEGIGIKKTATNLVFCDGNPEAPIMLIGEAPGADEDRIGKPFVGVSGQLEDKILACIDVDRNAEDPAKAIYISNILNWRPPGNRTPNPAEIEVSLPFIEKHIMLVKPKLLVLCGGVAAKALLGRPESISRLRKAGWHDYRVLTPELGGGEISIPAIATYHPAYLLRTPSQKKAVWADMLALQAKRKEIGLISVLK